MNLNPFSLDIMTSPLHPIYQGCDNYDYSGNHMGERKVVVTLQSATAIDFMVGDYITFNGEKFTLQTAPITSRIFSSHMIQYTLTFWWQGYELQLANFLDVLPSGDDSSVYFNKTSEVIIFMDIPILCGRIIANLDRCGYGGWSFNIHSSVIDTPAQNVEAINLQCLDVLQLINTQFGVEYQFDNATKTIYVGWPLDDVIRPRITALFEYGKDKGICEINRVQNDQKVITRVRGYGSTRNITPNYRHVEATKEYHTRLILPEDQAPLPIPNERYSIIDGYLVDTVQEAAYGIREGVPYINEDIYPTIDGLNNTVFAVGVVTDRPIESTPQYRTVIVTPERKEWVLKYFPYVTPTWVEVTYPAVVKEELIETVPQGSYDTATFFVPDLGFDINDESIKTGEPAKICFTTGNLVDAGELVIASFTKYMTLVAGVPTWDDGSPEHNQLWKVTVVRNSDDPNHIKPSEAVPIQVGDKFVYLNIFLPATYEDAAEARLLAATIEYLKANTKSPEGYAIRLSEEYFTKYPLTLGKFKEGNAVTIRDTVLGLSERAVLIQAMSVSYKDNALLPVYNLTISDVPIKGSLDVIRAGIKQSNQTITSRIITAENNTNSVLKSAYVLTSRILDNNLDIRGSIIAAQSITPISQSVELKSAHYMLQAIFTVNYEGAVNAANGSAGVLIHKEEDVVWADTYDLTHQTWTIAAPQTFSLLDGVRYFVYIKGSLVDGTAVWVVSQTKILATQDQGFYYFEWGSILAPIEGSRYTQTFTGLSHNPVSVDPASAAMASIDPVTQVLTVTGGSGGSFPATIDSSTTNADNGTTHTHELGNIAIENVVSGIPVEYGALYNWYAGEDTRKITSSDTWIIPYKSDWDTFAAYIGVVSDGSKVRSTNGDYWGGYPGTNQYKFTALGAGRRVDDGVFGEINNETTYFAKGTYNNGAEVLAGWYISKYNTQFVGFLDISIKYIGSPIRLVKTTTTLTHGQTGAYTGNDGKVYPTICIGTQEWLACNLNETKYRNGDWIHGFDGGVYTPISNAAWAALTTEAMCYYEDNEAYGGGQTPLSNQHNSLAGLNTGDYQHLTAAELAKLQGLTVPLQITGLTLLSASWTLLGSLYEYDLANANITAAMVVDVIPENADIAIVKAAEILPKTVSSAGSVKLYATNAPTGNIGVTIILTTATT